MTQTEMLALFPADSGIAVQYLYGKVYFKCYSEKTGKWRVREFTRKAWQEHKTKAGSMAARRRLFKKTLAIRKKQNRVK